MSACSGSSRHVGIRCKRDRLARGLKRQPVSAAIGTSDVPGMLRNSMTFALHRSISAIACAMVFTASCAAAEVIPQELAVDSNGGAVAVTRYAAEGTASRPAVLVLHGAGGIDVDPQAYARHGLTLAESGIDAYLVRYFGSGDRSCGCWDVWAERVADVTTAILQRPEASGRVGLLGFSLGGAVAATSARDPRIAALVVFYGFIPNSQRARIDRLPARSNRTRRRPAQCQCGGRRSHHVALDAADAVYFAAHPEAVADRLAASARVNEMIASAIQIDPQRFWKNVPAQFGTP
jgi:carboxymethylenebutenolidase